MLDDPLRRGFPLLQEPVQDPAVEAPQALLPYHLFQDAPGVVEAGEGRAVHEREVQQLLKPLLQRHQGAQQVAAVDAGDVAGLQRGQGPDVVPVQQMPPVELEAPDGFHGAAQGVDGLVEGQVPAIAGAQHARHPEADVGRAGPHGQAVQV